MTGQYFVEGRAHALLVAFVVAVEVVYPEVSYLCKLFVVENADAMGRSKQTVPDDHVWKVLKALFFSQPALKGMLKHMSSKLDDWGKLLELPVPELTDDSLHKL